jgi:multicomponent K+:H+ antiporter subunit C
MTVEAILAGAIGVLMACGLYLVLRARSFQLILGLVLLSQAVNLFLVAMGRVAIASPPVIARAGAAHADPLPQALVLTAIVISFGMTAYLVALALRVYLETGSDRVDGRGKRHGVDADW